MKIKEGYMLREVAGQSIVVAVGKTSLQFHGMIKLNETGTFLWKKLREENTKEQLLQSMLDTYEIDKETAKQDITKFLKTLREAKLLAE